jgi:Replication-relaxation
MNAPNRVGRIALERFRRMLSERETAILTSSDRFRYLTARQIESLHFFDHTSEVTAARTCRRVLERLVRAGVLQRLDRRIGGIRAGSAAFVYSLSPLGYRLLHDEDGLRRKHREPSPHFLDHTLAVAQLAVDLQVVARDGVVDIMESETEPLCWRSFTKGLAGEETLKPDLFIALGVGSYEHRWFVEVDLATASTAAVIRKCRVYHDYWATGVEQDRAGIFPKALWVAATERRATQLEQAISSAPRLNRDLFEVTVTKRAIPLLTESAS